MVASVRLRVPGARTAAHFGAMWPRRDSRHADLLLVGQDGACVAVHRCLLLHLAPALLPLLEGTACCGPAQVVVAGSRGVAVAAMADLLYTGTCSLAQVSAAEVLEVLEALHLRLSLGNLHLEEVQGMQHLNPHLEEVQGFEHLSPHLEEVQGTQHLSSAIEEVQGTQHLNPNQEEVHQVLDLGLYPTSCEDKARLWERVVAWEEGVATVNVEGRAGEVGSHVEERVEERVEEQMTEVEEDSLLEELESGDGMEVEDSLLEELESGEGMEVEVAQTAEVEVAGVPAVGGEEEDEVKVVQLVVKDEDGKPAIKQEAVEENAVADVEEPRIGPRRPRAASRFYCTLCHHSSKSQDQLTEHMSVGHSAGAPSLPTCVDCGYVTGTAHGLKIHMYHAHRGPGGDFACPFACSFKAGEEGKLVRHISTWHTDHTTRTRKRKSC